MSEIVLAPYVYKPVKIESPEAFSALIEQYLNDCNASGRFPSRVGLACFCSVSSDTIERLASEERFAPPYRLFLDYCEQWALHHGAFSKNQTFMSYYLKAYFKRYDQPASQTIIVDDRRDPDQIRTDMRRYIASHPAVVALAQYDEQGKG